MKYIIYEMIHHDKVINDEGYNLTTSTVYALVELDVSHVDSQHTSMENAVKEIQKHKKLLKYKQLTILPVIDIDYEGEIE